MQNCSLTEEDWPQRTDDTEDGGFGIVGGLRESETWLRGAGEEEPRAMEFAWMGRGH